MFHANPPCGVILFARNIQAPPQLAALIAHLRRVLPSGALLMVDQEGGRVARLRPPHWRAHPPAARLGSARAAWLSGALIGLDCAAAGFDVVAAPVLDLAVPGAHAVIGDRALAEEPIAVARLGRAFAAGLLAAGVQPVGKHAPGHGRARVDSHFALPRVEANDLGCRSSAVCLERRPALGHVGAHRLSSLGRRAASDVVPDRDRDDHSRQDRL